MRRIVLVRPAVEAGERLGFLPGDLVEKINPYLRPVYDALYDILGYDKVSKLIERQVIEIAPLAFMRGRTLNDAFIILDEAQNTTHEQMKMFLTRMGFHSKTVITGDMTQIDLPVPTSLGIDRGAEDIRGGEGLRVHPIHPARRGSTPAGAGSRRPLRALGGVEPRRGTVMSGRGSRQTERKSGDSAFSGASRRRVGWWDRLLDRPLLWALIAFVGWSILVVPRVGGGPAGLGSRVRWRASIW